MHDRGAPAAHAADRLPPDALGRGYAMRKSLAGVLGIALLGLPADRASAGATVDLLFVGRNGAPIAPTDSVRVGEDVSVGDELTLAVLMRNDAPLTLAIFSLRYDLEGRDELDVVSAFQWRGLAISRDWFGPIGDLSPTTGDFVGSFQGWTSNPVLPRTLPAAAGPFAGGYQMGTVTFRLKAGAHGDAADIVSGLLHRGVDAFGDGAFREVSHLVRFNAASVNFTPEPATACLLGLGLAGLALAGRRMPDRGQPRAPAARSRAIRSAS
jgi:hypothetical protein